MASPSDPKPTSSFGGAFQNRGGNVPPTSIRIPPPPNGGGNTPPTSTRILPLSKNDT